MGDYIERGVSAPGLDHSKKWDFVPTVKAGDSVGGQTIVQYRNSNYFSQNFSSS